MLLKQLLGKMIMQQMKTYTYLYLMEVLLNRYCTKDISNVIFFISSKLISINIYLIVGLFIDRC
jgi:hypothetical protein